MTTFRNLLLAILATVACTLSANVPSNLKAESLRYKVMFKWGLINKQAGTAQLTIRTQGDHYHTLLTARSDPWADKFYTLRDTLRGKVLRENFKPLIYENVANEDGDYKRDVVTYDYSTPAVVKAKCVHYRRKKRDRQGTTQTISLDSHGVALDMLSMYYYMRWLDYPHMGVGKETKLHIFSGRKKELLTITYKGRERLKYDGKHYDTFHISFTFTTDGGKKTSDDMDAWISANNARIPLKLEGKLKVGKVHCLYIGH